MASWWQGLLARWFRNKPTLSELGAMAECLAAMGAEDELAELLERGLRRPTKMELEGEFGEWCRAPREGEPPYEFLMGSPKAEKERTAEREAQVRVVLTRPLWVRPFSVTYRQWLLMTENPDHLVRWGYEPRLPVTNVNWFEASLYARWLGCWRHRHKVHDPGVPAEYCVSLPSEAQREFFTRAGTTTRFWQGDSDVDLGAVGWFDDNTEGRLHAVAQKPANPWGLHDVHGSVWEWCRDWYAAELRGGEDPLGPFSGRDRVLRGGSCWNRARGCRSASRSKFASDVAGFNLGFRLVLSAPTQAKNPSSASVIVD